MQIPCTIIKASPDSQVRTWSVTGMAEREPSVGQQFYLVSSESLTPGLPWRHVWTSPLVFMVVDALPTGERMYDVRTESGSRYFIVIHSGAERVRQEALSGVAVSADLVVVD